MTYPQQQGPYGGYQHPGSYQGGPPPKNNATAIAVVIVVVAVLAGIGITGFVAPGFFLSDDKESAADKGAGSGSGEAGAASDSEPPPFGGGDGGDAPAGGGGAEDAQVFAEEFLTAVNAKDEATAEGMICLDTPSNSLVSFVIGKNPQLEIAAVADDGSHFVDFDLGGTVDGKPLTVGSVAIRVSGGGSPCVFTFNAG